MYKAVDLANNFNWTIDGVFISDFDKSVFKKS